MRLAELKTLVSEHLHIEDEYVIDVLLAAVLAIEIPGEPLWMLLVSPPGGTKTELLRCLTGAKIYTLSSLTPHTLVSGLKAKKNPDLLPQLDGKLLVIKDFTSILSKRDQDRNEIFSQLREAYDGYYEAAFGSGTTKKSYHAKFGVLAGVTEAIDMFHTVHALLGERFLKYRVQTDVEKAIAKARENSGKEDMIRKLITAAMSEYLELYRGSVKDNEVVLSDEMNAKLEALANITAKLRTPVARDRNRHMLYAPRPEIGTRLMKQLKKLGIALTYLHDEVEMDAARYETLKRVVRDTVPHRRFDVVDALARFPQDEDRTSKQVAQELRLPTSWVQIALEDMWALGLLGRQGTDVYYWSLPEETVRLLKNAELV